MRMPGTQIRFDPGREGGVRDPFVELEEMWMSLPDAKPDYFWAAFGRESPEAGERKEEARKLNREQLGAQFFFRLRCHVAKKSEREMDLLGGDPADTGQPRI